MAKFHSFLCLSNISQSKYVISSLSIPLLIHIWVSYNLTIVNNVAMNISSVQFHSVAQSCPNFCDPMDAACPASLSVTNSCSYSNSCPLNQWCHPTISSSVIPFSSCLQSFPASGLFPMSWLFTSGHQSIGASASVLPINWFLLGMPSFISLQSRDSQESSQAPQLESINSSVLSLLDGPSHRVTIYSLDILDVLLSQFWTSPLFHVWF